MSNKSNTAHTGMVSALSRQLNVTVVVMVFAVIGTIAFAVSQAGAPTVSIQVEGGTQSGNVSILTDSSASGNAAIKFNAPISGTVCATTTPYTPDGPDPWGGCWPGPTTTGVPTGMTLQKVPQDVTSGTGWHWSAGDYAVRIDSCGSTLNNLDIDGGILMRVGNGTDSPDTPCTTLANSVIRSDAYVDDSGCASGCGPLVIKNSNITVTGSVDISNVVYTNFWLYNVNSFGGRGPSCNGACGIYDSWVHGLYLEGAVHHNDLGTNGVGNGPFIMQHNYLNCADFSAVDPDTTEGAGCSADIGLYGDFADLKNITIYRSYLAPALSGGKNLSYAQPGYCFQTGMGVNKPYNQPSNLIVRQNIFAKGVTGKCGTFGIDSGWDGAVRGNVWDSNKWDDGTTANP